MSNETRTPDTNLDLIGMAAEIVCAYVANNPVPTSELPGLIRNTLQAVRGLTVDVTGAAAAEAAVEKPTPAQIKKSITPGGLISFLDGRSYKTLKRHLTTHGLDPHGYRQRFGLPSDYPTTCSDYSEMRSNISKSMGLGRKPAALKKAA